MSYAYLQILIPFAGLLINVLMQILSLRFIPGMGLLRSEYLGFVVGFVGLVLGEFYVLLNTQVFLSDFVATIIVNGIIYILLGYIYFHFVNLGETGRRIRILREIYDSSEGLTEQELLSCYSSREIVEKRIPSLLNSRQIIERQGRYYIYRPEMLIITKIINLLKDIFFKNSNGDKNFAQI